MLAQSFRLDLRRDWAVGGYVRVYLLALTALLVCARPGLAQVASKPSPFEVVKMHVDIALAPGATTKLVIDAT